MNEELRHIKMMRKTGGYYRGGKWVNEYWSKRYMKKENYAPDDWAQIWVQTKNYWVIKTTSKHQNIPFKMAEELFLKEHKTFTKYLNKEEVRDFIYEHKEDEGMEEYWREKEEREEEEINRLVEDLMRDYEQEQVYNAMRKRWR